MKCLNKVSIAILSLGLALVVFAANEAPKPAAVPVPVEVEGEKGGRVEGEKVVPMVASKPVPVAKEGEKDGRVEGEKAAPVVASKPAPEVKEPVEVEKKTEEPKSEKRVAESNPVNEVDEITIEDFDDSAVAAKGRPTVKLAKGEGEKEKGDRVEGEKGGRVAQEGEKTESGREVAASDSEAAAKKTGAEIAAKYLAADESALVDIVSDDATLTDILRQFRKATGANIIYAESSNLQQRVSVSLQRVPWLQAMGSILNSRGFRVESSGGIHFVKEDKLKDPTFTRSFVLNHASADELAKLFNDSYGVKAPDGKLIRGVATAFQGANTVVVTATERILADCEKIVSSVDRAVPQIYIEARFIELSNQSMHKLGMQWNQLESWGASVKDVSGGMTYSNGRHNRFYQGQTATMYQPKQYDASGNDISTGKSAVDYITKNYLVSESTDSDVGDVAWRNARVFSGQLSVADFNLAMSAFEKLEDARIFSNPKIIVSNGKKAMVDMTTKFPNVKIQATRNTSNGSDSLDISTQLEVIPGEDKQLFAKEAFFSWGITLEVTPRISPDGLISVEIIPQISQLDTSVVMDNNQVPNGFIQVKGGDSSAMSYYPIIEVKRLTTDFSMKDGATAVIGGLSKTEEGDVDSGIPYLREIPWIGNKIFGWKSREKVQKEIVVFVTVGIADPANLPEDIGLPKNAVRGREYVEKHALEPGDRPEAAAKILDLDMRPLEVQQKDVLADRKVETSPSKESSTRGTVTITPVSVQEKQ